MTAQRLFFASLIVLLGLAWYEWETRPLTYPPGLLIEDRPVQRAVSEPAFEFKGYQLTPRARFELAARVLSRRDYRFDAGAALAPTDLALGWGPMSNQAVLDDLKISQSSRWYRYEWARAPIPPEEIGLHSSNMHIIPANATVADQLDRVREGQLLQLQGQLVDVRGDDGFIWTTSLSRADTGDGACELFYVERLVFR